MGGPLDWIQMGQAYCGDLFGVVEKSLAVNDMGNLFFERHEPQLPV